MENSKLRDEWCALYVQINSQLKRNGKPLSEMPDSEWKTWILDLIKYRDSITPKI